MTFFNASSRLTPAALPVSVPTGMGSAAARSPATGSALRLVVAAPLLLALAACATLDTQAQPQPVPQSVQLSQSTLTVRLSDGGSCVLENWQARPQGHMADCGPGLGYAVQPEDRPNLLYQMMSGLDLTLAAGRLVPPMAEVVLTDPAGIDYSFASPLPPRRHD